MFEVIVKEIEYIKGIPLEFTQEVIKQGGIRVGECVGLIVSLVDDPPRNVCIELQLDEHGQERLITEGQKIPVEDEHAELRFHDSWRHYLEHKG